MSDLCRRCPNHDAPGGGSVDRRPSLFDHHDHDPFHVVLDAGLPSLVTTDGARMTTAWNRAISAVVAATMQRGGSITVPATPEVALHVALAAAPWATPMRTEGATELPRVRIHESDEYSTANRALLAPLVLRNLAALFDEHGERIGPRTLRPDGGRRVDESRSPDRPGDDLDAQKFGPSPSGRRFDFRGDLGSTLSDARSYPLDGRMIEGGLGVILVAPDADLGWMAWDLEANVAVIDVGPRPTADWARDLEIGRLTDHRDEPWRGDRPFRNDDAAAAGDPDDRASVDASYERPFGFLAEQLIDRWRSGM